MKFNYMLPKVERIKRCDNGKEHYYIPTSNSQATINHISIRFVCKHCRNLAIAFLTQEEYEINKNLLNKYGTE